MFDSDLRRALGFIVPYWRRLALVLALSALSTALSLYLPLLSRDFFDRALIGRDLGTLVRVVSLFAAVSVASFVVNVVSGMRYTRVVADILFGIGARVRYRTRLEVEIGKLRQRSADIGSFLIETLQSVKLVVTSNAQEREVGRFRERNAAFIDALMSMQLLSYLSGGLPGLVLSAGTGAVFVYGGLRVINGSITVGTFVAFMAYQMRFLPPLQALMGMYANLATVRVSLRRVAQILDEPVDVIEAADAVDLPPVRGDVEFDEVTVSFGRGGPVLERFSFSVRAGETLAIVGPSGSGKSTIADLLLRLIDPDAGAVRLDGRDLRTVRLADLR